MIWRRKTRRDGLLHKDTVNKLPHSPKEEIRDGIQSAIQCQMQRQLSSELDHSYNLSSENQDPVYNVSRQEDIVSDCTSDVELEWRTGRRVVELGTLANGLKACQLCSQPLHLINTVGERKFGLAQILKVKCMYSQCGLVNDVLTGRKHTSQNGGQAWDVNTKLAAGMITMQYCLYIFKISTITCIQCLLGISIIQYVFKN